MMRHQGGTPPGADRKPVNLALQGGGAHGAFAWGVLDKLLEDGRLTIDAMSATSAGAMNAVVAAYGLSIGGPNGAREKLEEFWRHISSAGQLYSPVRSRMRVLRAVMSDPAACHERSQAGGDPCDDHLVEHRGAVVGPERHRCSKHDADGRRDEHERTRKQGCGSRNGLGHRRP